MKPQLCLLDILRPASALATSDTLGKALHLSREALTPLPVVQGGILCGMIDETALSSLQGIEDLDCRFVLEAMEPVRAVGYPSESLSSAWVKCESLGLPVLFAVDPRGTLVGYASRGDLLSALRGRLRPPRVGGMATLGGVRLTTGSILAGAGDKTLFLTGMAFGFLNWAIFSLLAFWEPLNLFLPAGEFLAFLLFILFLRLSPLSGYHGAEHQVVHALEKGEPISQESLARQPREHPRCGTNLVAIFLGIAILLPSDNPIVLMTGAILIFLYWRKVGMLLQRFFTTKPPTQAQSQAAIEAAEELLARFQERPSFRAKGPARFWGTGIAQILLGMLSVEIVKALLPLCGRIL